MSVNHGDLVKLRLMDDGGPWDARYADWRGRITDVVERHGRHLVDVEPPIPYIDDDDLEIEVDGIVGGGYGRGRFYLRVWQHDEGHIPEDVHDDFGHHDYDDGPIRAVTRVPEYFLEVVSRPKRPKSAAKGRQFFFDARTDMPPGVFDAFEERSRKARARAAAAGERRRAAAAALLRHVAEDRAYARARRDAAAAAEDADFHDAADTREKTLSAAVQSDIAQARTKKKGGRGRRRRRKRTRRTRRRKKRRTRRRRRKRTRRRRRR